MPAARRRHTVTQRASAYVSFLRRSEPPEWAELREAAQPYKAKHLAASWEAGWLSYGVRRLLGDGFTDPTLSRTCSAAWLRGYQAREALASAIHTQED